MGSTSPKKKKETKKKNNRNNTFRKWSQSHFSIPIKVTVLSAMCSLIYLAVMILLVMHTA